MAPVIGYHASHEQYSPSELLEYVQRADAAGFGAAMCSDHFHPWTEAQGQSGFAWSWLGAALQATRLPFGVVNAPAYRYHPAIVAQAAATLAEMFPARFWLAVGSGEALNEHITGERWPPKQERHARLLESVRIMRALWAGETVTQRGLVCIEQAKLYTRPASPPLLAGAALTPATAGWVASWADALITTNQPMAAMQHMVAAFRDGGGADKPMFLQVQVAYGASEAWARHDAHEQWGALMLGSEILAELRTPQQFEQAGRHITAADLDDNVLVSTDLERHIETLHAYAALGFEQIYVHNVARDQQRFIDDYGARVLPAFQLSGSRTRSAS